MVHVTSVILCDFAQVREGLLFVSSGGVNRISAPAVPAPIPVYLAMMLHVPYDEIDQLHELKITIHEVATATQVAEYSGGFRADGPTGEPGEESPVCLVLSLADRTVPDWGAYDVKVTVDGNLGPMLTFYARPSLPAAGSLDLQ